MEGTYRQSDGTLRHFSWVAGSGELLDLGPAPDDPQPEDEDENTADPLEATLTITDTSAARGQSVGQETRGNDSFPVVKWRDVIWDLNNQTAQIDSWSLTDAIAINDSGHILAHGLKNGKKGSILLAPVVDVDGDGMDDAWESSNQLNPYLYSDRSLNEDDDQLSAVNEFRLGINPFDSDSDGDLINDNIELLYGLDPGNPLDANLDHDNNGFTTGTISPRPVATRVVTIITVQTFEESSSASVISLNDDDFVVAQEGNPEEVDPAYTVALRDLEEEALLYTLALRPQGRLGPLPKVAGFGVAPPRARYWEDGITKTVPLPVHETSRAVGFLSDDQMVVHYTSTSGETSFPIST